MNPRFDAVIRNAQVFDGSGAPAFASDVAIDADRIARIGDLGGASAGREIDATGLALAPGFIDVHTHDDFAVMAAPDMAFKSRGGVTTCMVGNCGFGAAPYAAAKTLLGGLTPGLEPSQYEGHAGYAAAVEHLGPGVNIGVLAGHGTIRLAAMGHAPRDANTAELAQMCAIMDEALDAGVFGLSSGLAYDPGRYAPTQELIEIAAQMRGSGALYATHLRDQGEHLLESVAEAIEIGDKAGVGVQISHHKASGRENWGQVRESLKLIDAAQARGLKVYADQYPYTAGSTMLAAVLLNDAFNPSGAMSSLRPADVVVASAPGHPQWEGQSIETLSMQMAGTARATAEHVVAQCPSATAILHMISEDDVQTVMRHASTMIGSDGIPALGGRPHPRLYNSFARVLGHYSRELAILDMTTAVHRMTGFSASVFGITDRGLVTPGAFADLVLFDPASIIDQGTFDEPNQYPTGIQEVFVNGVSTIRDDKVSGTRAGRLLRR
jgi:N-acyl-D-amino-acid deacylase